MILSFALYGMPVWAATDLLGGEQGDTLPESNTSTWDPVQVMSPTEAEAINTQAIGSLSDEPVEKADEGFTWPPIVTYDGYVTGSGTAESEPPDEYEPISYLAPQEPEQPAVKPLTWEDVAKLLSEDLKKTIEDGIKAGAWTQDDITKIFNDLNKRWEFYKDLWLGTNESGSPYEPEFQELLKTHGIDPKGKRLVEILTVLRGKQLTEKNRKTLFAFLAEFIGGTYTNFKAGRYDPAKTLEVGASGNCTGVSILIKLFTDFVGISGVSFVDVAQAGDDRTPHAMIVWTVNGKKYWTSFGGGLQNFTLAEKLPEDMKGITDGLGWNRAFAWILQWKAIEIYEPLRDKDPKSQEAQDALRKIRALMDKIKEIDEAFMKDPTIVKFLDLLNKYLIP
jgi:hypothetical protein